MSEESQVTYKESEVRAEREHVSRLLKEHEYVLTKSQAMKRLVTNPDFKEVFIEYYQDTYLKQRVDDLALATSPQIRQSAQDKVLAIGSFKQFVRDLLVKESEVEMEAMACRKHLDFLDSVPVVEGDE